MSTEQRWKPFVAVAVVVAVGAWWYTAQAPFATLKDGTYSCGGVYVNESGKYEMLVDESGESYNGGATVEDGKVTEIYGDTAMSSSQVASLIVRSKGTSHFHATDDRAVRMYYAIACDFARS